MQEAPGVTVLMLKAGGVIAATCTLVVIPSLTRSAQPYALIENVVTDAARQSGFGRAVMQAAVAAAWAAGCYKTMLVTGSKSPATLRFDAGLGFSQTKTGFHMRHP